MAIHDIIHLSDLSDSGATSVHCPECGFEYSHILEVFTRVGDDAGPESQAYKGTIAKGRADARRSCLVIQFTGECGHNWEICFQQHKGINYVEARLLPSPVPAP